MKRNDPISHIMSRNVVTAHHGDPISKVRALVRQHGVHHIPVVSGDQLVGIITWSDILRVSFGDAFHTDERTVDATLDHTLSLEQIMQKNPVTLAETGTVREAAEILAGGSFHSVPIVSGSKLVGIVTSTDIIKYLLDQF
ncbi:CBS domain-containing protein [Prosthecobacter vanneervenii]|uniref:Putative transcriptional regulator n=1 Tax=Prosthecobacter vanneervenii TaxID=48466 RepID=A0A7W8DIB3_9BACT|nr:CBS domain-containing protein [Prosthecobacter vanneervenii]MBB5030994.1 putative transcriptional regulator [Prosthecobacter vanneervenii]